MRAKTLFFCRWSLVRHEFPPVTFISRSDASFFIPFDVLRTGCSRHHSANTTIRPICSLIVELDTIMSILYVHSLHSLAGAIYCKESDINIGGNTSFDNNSAVQEDGGENEPITN